MKLFNDVLGIHEKALAVRDRRMEIIAGNIANADTPHFKAKDLDFKSILAQSNATPMAVTNTRHFETGDTSGSSAIVYRIPYNAAVDGNTVEMQVEQAKYGEAAGDYQATLNFLNSRIGGIRKALKGE
jgi:flagellar basal-body rod protein FlgB